MGLGSVLRPVTGAAVTALKFNPNHDDHGLFSTTDDPGFKSWFKDSKVVDDSGNPLRVFHGTDKDFEAFDTSKSLGQVWFTPRPELASAYSTAERRGDLHTGAEVIPLHVSMQNPKIYDGTWQEAAAKWYSGPNSATLQAQGYDGVLFKENGKISTGYVFDPRKVKSAIGSTHDPLDARITKAWKYKFNPNHDERGRFSSGDAQLAGPVDAKGFVVDHNPPKVGPVIAAQNQAWEKQQLDATKEAANLKHTLYSKYDIGVQEEDDSYKQPITNWLQTLQAVDRESERLKAMGVNFPVAGITIERGMPPKDADGVTHTEYNQSTIRINAHTDRTDEDIAEQMGHEKERGTVWSQASYYQERRDTNNYVNAIYRHELGHALSLQDPMFTHKLADELNKGKAGPDSVYQHVSMYAASGLNEGLAEIFAKYTDPSYKKGSMPKVMEHVAQEMIDYTNTRHRYPVHNLTNHDLLYDPKLKVLTGDVWPMPSQSIATRALKFNPYHDEHGRFASSGDGMELVSPNVEEGLNLTQASQALTSQRQADVMTAFRGVDQILGLKAEYQPIIGAWADGAENSVMSRISGNPSYDQLKLSAAMKGMLADQKAVVPFKSFKGGPDTMYRIKVPHTDLQKAHDELSSMGLEFHSLKIRNSGIDAFVYDEGSKLGEAAQKVSDFYGTQTTKWHGQGEFLGSWDSRTEGRGAYQKEISAHLGSDQLNAWNRLYSDWRKTHAALKVEVLKAAASLRKTWGWILGRN